MELRLRDRTEELWVAAVFRMKGHGLICSLLEPGRGQRLRVGEGGMGSCVNWKTQTMTAAESADLGCVLSLRPSTPYSVEMPYCHGILFFRMGPGSSRRLI